MQRWFFALVVSEGLLCGVNSKGNTFVARNQECHYLKATFSRVLVKENERNERLINPKFIAVEYYSKVNFLKQIEVHTCVSNGSS